MVWDLVTQKSCLCGEIWLFLTEKWSSGFNFWKALTAFIIKKKWKMPINKIEIETLPYFWLEPVCWLPNSTLLATCPRKILIEDTQFLLSSTTTEGLHRTLQLPSVQLKVFLQNPLLPLMRLNMIFECCNIQNSSILLCHRQRRKVNHDLSVIATSQMWFIWTFVLSVY